MSKQKIRWEMLLRESANIYCCCLYMHTNTYNHTNTSCTQKTIIAYTCTNTYNYYLIYQEYLKNSYHAARHKII